MFKGWGKFSLLLAGAARWDLARLVFWGARRAMTKLVAGVVGSGWQAVVAVSRPLMQIYLLLYYLLLSILPTSLVLWSAIDAALDQILGEWRWAVSGFFWVAFFTIIIASFFSHDEYPHPLSTRLARRICSRYPGFKAYRARKPKSASSTEDLLASELRFSGGVTLMARFFIIVVLTIWFGDSSSSPTDLPWLVHPIGVILDLAIVLYLTVIWYRHNELKPTLAEDSAPIGTLRIINVDQEERDFNRRMFREILAWFGICIIIPALEVSLSLWLF